MAGADTGALMRRRSAERQFRTPPLRKFGLPHSPAAGYGASDYQLQDTPIMRSLALAAVLVIAAFGSVQAADPAPVSITIKDRQFVPAEVTVPAGAKVELQIRNEQTTAAEFESKSMRREKVIPPGGSVSLYIGPLNPGRYDFFDDFHPATRGIVVVK
jgi:plastocyanin